MFALGLGVPFFVAAAFAEPFMHASTRLRARLPLIEKAIGVFLVLTGVVVATGDMPAIANWLYDAFPALTRIG